MIALPLVFAAAVALAGTHEDNMKALKSIPLVKGFEERSSDEGKIATQLQKIFSKIADEARNSDGTLNRGTHATGSCFDAELKVLSEKELSSSLKYPEDVVKRIRKGLFAKEGIYPTEVRFANAKGERNPDTTGDVRAVSFSIDTLNLTQSPVGNSRIDFMFNSSPMFAVNNIKEFHELMKAARVFSGDVSYVINPFYLKAVLRAQKLLSEYERSDIKSYATEVYWTNLPYTHGMKGNVPEEVVKYKVIPCGLKDRVSESSEGKAADFLQQDIRNRVSAGNVCFNLQVQLFDLKKLQNSLGGMHRKWKTVDWIENGGELWEESVLPFYTVARLEVPSHLNSQKASCKSRFINTRIHSAPEHLPLGSIARVRTTVEEVSRARRMGERN